MSQNWRMNVFVNAWMGNPKGVDFLPLPFKLLCVRELTWVCVCNDTKNLNKRMLSKLAMSRITVSKLCLGLVFVKARTDIFKGDMQSPLSSRTSLSLPLITNLINLILLACLSSPDLLNPNSVTWPVYSWLPICHPCMCLCHKNNWCTIIPWETVRL